MSAKHNITTEILDDRVVINWAETVDGEIERFNVSLPYTESKDHLMFEVPKKSLRALVEIISD